MVAGIARLPWPWGFPLSVMLGLVTVRMFVIYHDYMHGAILRRSGLAGTALRLFGYLALSPPQHWRHSHDEHHHNNCRNFGASVGSFPVLTVEQYHASPLRKRMAYRVVRHPLTIACGYLTGFVWSSGLAPLIRNPRSNWQCLLAMLLHVAIYAALAMWSWKLLVFAWIIPLMVAGGLGTYLFYVQHNFPGIQRLAPERWDYVLAALQSSSFLRMGWAMNWFTGNIGYHHVHHLNHKIPFYRLPETMRGIPELQSPVSTTLSPRDVVRCLRLKLWDAVDQRLVTYGQAQSACSTRA
jgi:omega-6 fatty acid desaturase (delta-12 desaturase)